MVKGKVLRQLDYYNTGFKLIMLMTGIFSLLFVMCCVGSDLFDEMITRLQTSYRMCVSNCVRSRHFKNAAAKFYLRRCATKKNIFQNSSIYGLSYR